MSLKRLLIILVIMTLESNIFAMDEPNCEFDKNVIKNLIKNKEYNISILFKDICIEKILAASDQDICTLTDEIVTHSFSEEAKKLLLFLIKTRQDFAGSEKLIIRISALAHPTMRSHLLLFAAQGLKERDFNENSHMKRNSENLSEAVINGAFRCGWFRSLSAGSASTKDPIFDKGVFEKADYETMANCLRLVTPIIEEIYDDLKNSEIELKLLYGDDIIKKIEHEKSAWGLSAKKKSTWFGSKLKSSYCCCCS